MWGAILNVLELPFLIKVYAKGNAFENSLFDYILFKKTERQTDRKTKRQKLTGSQRQKDRKAERQKNRNEIIFFTNGLFV
jgi:hypothetical protein